jgi:hypothetical protein
MTAVTAIVGRLARDLTGFLSHDTDHFHFPLANAGAMTAFPPALFFAKPIIWGHDIVGRWM